MQIIFHLIINALVILSFPYWLPGISVNNFYSALIAAIILGIVNIIIKPILIILTLPITIVTLGLFTLVINGLLFWFVSTVVKGFSVSGFWPAFVGALILSLVNWLFRNNSYEKLRFQPGTKR